MAATEWQLAGQVSVDAQRIDRQNGIGWLVRIEVRVVRCEEHFGARHAGGADTSSHMVKAAWNAWLRIALCEPMKWTPWTERAVGQCLALTRDAPDLRSAADDGRPA